MTDNIATGCRDNTEIQFNWEDGVGHIWKTGNLPAIRRLPELHGQRLLERIIKDGIPGGVGEICENDGVFLGQGLGLARTIVKSTSINASTTTTEGTAIVQRFLLLATERSTAFTALDDGGGATFVETDTGVACPAAVWVPLSCTAATVPELAAVARPVSLSRFSRCNSERISAALWWQVALAGGRLPNAGRGKTGCPKIRGARNVSAPTRVFDRGGEGA